MMLAKPAGMKPRDLAARLVEAIPAHEQLAKVEIAGPGFLNFFQDHVWLAASLDRALADERLGVRKAGPAQRVVIDLSSPNLARRCTSATCVRPSSATPSRASSSSSATR